MKSLEPKKIAIFEKKGKYPPKIPYLSNLIENHTI